MPESQTPLQKILAWALNRDANTVSLAAPEHGNKTPKIRVVRTAEGAKYYGVPIGTPIKAAKANRAAVKGAGAANPEIEDAPKPSTKAPAVSIGGTPIDFAFEPHSEVYVQEDANPKNAGMKLVREPDGTWHQVSSTGVTTLGPAMSGIMEDSLEEGKLSLDTTHHDPSGSLPKLKSALPDDNPDNPDLTDDDGNLKVKVDAIKDAQSKGNVVSNDKGEPISAEELATKPDDEPVTVAGTDAPESKTVPAKQAKEDLSKTPEEAAPEKKTDAPEAATPDAAAEEPADGTQEFGGVQATPDQMISALEALEDSYVHNAGAGAVNQVGPAIKKRDPSNPLVGMDHKAVATEHKAGETGNAKMAVKQAVIAALLEKLDSTNLSDKQNAKVDKVREQFDAKVNEAETGKGLVRVPTGDGSTVQVGQHHYKPGKYSTGTGDAKTYMVLHPDGTADYHSKKGVEKISSAVFEKNYTKRGMKKHAPVTGADETATEPKAEAPKAAEPKFGEPGYVSPFQPLADSLEEKKPAPAKNPVKVASKETLDAFLPKDSSLKDQTGNPILPPKAEPKDDPQAQMKAALDKAVNDGKAQGDVQTVASIQTYDKATGEWGVNNDSSLTTPYGTAKTQPKPKGQPTHDVDPQNNANGYSVLDKGAQGLNGDGYADSGLWGKYGAAGVMISHTDEQGVTRYLLVQRGKGVSSNNGKWQLPGGAINSKETDQEGASRELMEELAAPTDYLSGLTHVGEVKFEHKSGWHYNNLAAVSPTMFEPIVDGSETSDAQWFTEEQIAKLDLVPAFAANMPKVIKTIKDHKEGDHSDTPEISDPDAPGKIVNDKKAEELAEQAPNAPEKSTEPKTVSIKIKGEEEATLPAGGKLYHQSHLDPEDATVKYYVQGDKVTAVDPYNDPKVLDASVAAGVLKSIEDGIFTEESLNPELADVEVTPPVKESTFSLFVTIGGNTHKVPKVQGGYLVHAQAADSATSNAKYYVDPITKEVHQISQSGIVTAQPWDDNATSLNWNDIKEMLKDGDLVADANYKVNDPNQPMLDGEFNGTPVGKVPDGEWLAQYSGVDGETLLSYYVKDKSGNWWTVGDDPAEMGGPVHILDDPKDVAVFNKHLEDGGSSTIKPVTPGWVMKQKGASVDSEEPQHPIHTALKEAIANGNLPANGKLYSAKKNESIQEGGQGAYVVGDDVYRLDADGEISKINPVTSALIKKKIADDPDSYAEDPFDAASASQTLPESVPGGVDVEYKGKVVGQLPPGSVMYKHPTAPIKYAVTPENKWYMVTGAGVSQYPAAEGHVMGVNSPYVKDGEWTDKSMAAKTAAAKEYTVPDGIDGLGGLQGFSEADLKQELQDGNIGPATYKKALASIDKQKVSTGGSVEVLQDPALWKKYEYAMPEAGMGGATYAEDGNGDLWNVDTNGNVVEKVNPVVQTYLKTAIDNGEYFDPTSGSHTPIMIQGKVRGHVPAGGKLYHNSNTSSEDVSKKFYVVDDKNMWKVTSEGVTPYDGSKYGYDAESFTYEPWTEDSAQNEEGLDSFLNSLMDAIPDGQSNKVVVNVMGNDFEVEGGVGGKLYSVGKHAPVKYLKKTDGTLISINKHGPSVAEPGNTFEDYPEDYHEEEGWDNGLDPNSPAGLISQKPSVTVHTQKENAGTVPLYVHGQEVGQVPPYGSAYYNGSVYADDHFPDSYFYEDNAGKVYSVSGDGVKELNEGQRKNFYDSLDTTLKPMTHVYNQPSKDDDLESNVPAAEIPDGEGSGFQTNHDIPQKVVLNGAPITISLNDSSVDGEVPGGGRLYVDKAKVGQPDKHGYKIYITPEGEVYKVDNLGVDKVDPMGYNVDHAYKLAVYDGGLVPDPAFEQGYAQHEVPVYIQKDFQGMLPAGGTMLISPEQDSTSAKLKFYHTPKGDLYKISSISGAKKYEKSEDPGSEYQIALDMLNDPENAWVTDDDFKNGTPDNQPKVPVLIKGKHVGSVPFGGQMFLREQSTSDNASTKYYLTPTGSVYRINDKGPKKLSANDSSQWKLEHEDGMYVPDPSHIQVKSEIAPLGDSANKLVPLTLHGQTVGFVEPGGKLYYGIEGDGTGKPEESSELMYVHPNGNYYSATAGEFKKFGPDGKFDPQTTIEELVQDGMYKEDKSFVSLMPGEVAVTVQGKKVGKVPAGGTMMHPKYSNAEKTPHKLYAHNGDLYDATDYGVTKLDDDNKALFQGDIDGGDYAVDTSFGPTGVQEKGFVPVSFEGNEVGMVPAGGTLHWNTNTPFGAGDPDAILADETFSHHYKDSDGNWWDVTADGVKKSTLGNGTHDGYVNDGYYGTIPFDSSAKAPAAVQAKEMMSDLPMGGYSWAGGNLNVNPDGSVSFKAPGDSEESMLSPTDVSKLFTAGQVKDQYGTSISLPGSPEQKISLFDGKPKTTQQLEKVLSKLLVSDDSDALSILAEADLGEDTNKAEAYATANGLAPTIGGVKATYVHAINKILAGKKSGKPQPTKVSTTPGAPSYLGPFELNDEGHAKQPLLSELVQSATDSGTMTSKRKYIQGIQEGHFSGTIGQGAKAFSIEDANSWLNAYQHGNMRKLYEIEKKHVPKALLLNHPGAPGNDDTHYVAFAPVLPGQVPAGENIDGMDHVTFPSDLTEDDLDKYLAGANMHLAHHLSEMEKWEFAEAHVSGNHVAANAVASRAMYRQKSGDAPLTSTLNTGSTSKSKKAYSHLVDKDIEPALWHQAAVDDFLADNNLTDATENLNAYSKMGIIEAVLRESHLSIEDKKAAAWADPNGLVLKNAGTDGIHFGNNTAVRWMTDQFGDQHIFKPALNSGEQFRVDIEHEMNLLARGFGFGTPDSKIVTVDGKVGQLQRKLEAVPVPALSKLNTQQRIDLAGEHLLDHMLESDDARGDNIKMTSDGRIIGIDKGRAWAKNGKWDSLRPDVKTVEGGPTVYAGLYDQIASGAISGDEAEEIYRAVSMKAQAMSQVSDADVRASFERAFANRPDSGVGKAALIDQAVARKNALADDMDKLWSKVFANAGLTKPQRPANTIKNDQGHVLHTGFTPEYFERVEANKFHGKTTFFAGNDLEDMALLMHTEKRGGHDITMGELKVRRPRFYAIQDFLKERATGGAKPKEDTVDVHNHFPAQNDMWYKIERSARTLEVHHEDGKPNMGTIAAMRDLAPKVESEVLRLMTEKGEGSWNAKTPQEKHEHDQQLAMYQKYQGAINEVERAIKDGTLPDVFAKEKFEYKPYVGPKVAAPKKPKATFTVKREQAWRAASTAGYSSTHVDDDGQAHTDETSKLKGESQGQTGYQYVATLKTGERITFRGGTKETGTKTSQQGQIGFEIPNGHDKAESMARIRAALGEMGLPLTEAQPADYELFYWRHLKGIMEARRDSQQGSDLNKNYNGFWSALDSKLEDKGGQAEVEMWRNAFSKFPEMNRAKIDAFVASGQHLPQFDNYDPHQPTEGNSLPYWNRFDVSVEQAKTKEAPHATMNAALAVTKSGGSYSTDSRLRQFGGAFVGMSPDTDQTTGGSNYIFLRQNQQNDGYGGVWLEPTILRRTSNFAFNGDLFGATARRRHYSPFDFEDSSSLSESGNEVCVKNGLSILNAIAAINFTSSTERNKAIAYYKKLGITEIRGVPIEDRFLLSGSMTTELAKKLGLKGKKSPKSAISHPGSDQAGKSKEAAQKKIDGTENDYHNAPKSW